MLIEKDIVPAHMADKARELVSFISDAEPIVEPRTPYKDVVEVSVSQLIEHSFRKYDRGDEIRGIILLAENTSDQDIYPTAVRNCQITYQIFQGEAMLYDSASKRACEAQEMVSYRLGPGQSRMFEVRHTQLEYSLDRGEYRMRISYPGYGEGTRTFTVE
jgi:hypothetical protein